MLTIGIVAFVIVLALGIALHHSFESRVRNALTKHDLNSKQGVTVHFRREVHRSARGGKYETLHIDYSVNLGGGPAGALHIIREGTTSAGLEARGEREVVTDDKDFNDYFWVRSSAEGYLTPARQKLLVHGFESLPAGVYIKSGSIHSTIEAAGAFGVGSVVGEITRAVALASWLKEPDTYVKHLPQKRPGWVGRRMRRRTCFGFWTSSLSLLAGLVVLNFPMSELKLDGGMVAAILTLALALLYFTSGLLYLTANKFARRFADISLFATLFCLLLVDILAGLVSVGVLFIALLITIIVAYVLHHIRLALNRVPMQ